VDINELKSVKITLASPEDIRSWSHGEVKKPETINYRTLKPERDGLFCERIFGPVKDYECYCGHYKKPRYKGIVCERCGVEVTKSDVRRVRMGHIELAAPVAHPWYYKTRPIIARVLDMKSNLVNDIISFSKHIILDVDFNKRENDLHFLEKELEEEIREIDERKERELKRIEEEYDRKINEIEERINSVESESEKLKLEKEKSNLISERKRESNDIKQELERRKEFIVEVFNRFKELKPRDIFDESTYDYYNEMRERYGEYFRSGTGAEAIKYLLSRIDLEEEAKKLKEEIRNSKGQAVAKLAKRLEAINGFLKNGTRPEWMILDVLPVLPPDLRPMVQLDGGRFGTSDLNDLYRRVINRNNRLKRLLEINAPELILNNEKRMLQEAINALIDNDKLSRPITNGSGRQLKSLSDILKGKQGRFRENLLGKRVDYSGRSVIVVGPELKLHQCGLPKIMALELFKPFAIRRLIELGHAQNIKQAKKFIEMEKPIVWDALEDVIKDKLVLLNRAPTLHKLSIQAFEPKLIEGKAIKIHPLVCPPFNADFDGDQMAVHVPLSARAQAEARILMLSSLNILSPANGKPIAAPTQDIVAGVYHLTSETTDIHKEKGVGKYFASVEEALYAYETGNISLKAPIYVRIAKKDGSTELVKTTAGRLIFNQALSGVDFINTTVDKKNLYKLMNDLLKGKYDSGNGNGKLSMSEIAEIIDNIKEIGFEYATRSVPTNLGFTTDLEIWVGIYPEKMIIQKVSEIFEEVLNSLRELRAEVKGDRSASKAVYNLENLVFNAKLSLKNDEEERTDLSKVLVSITETYEHIKNAVESLSSIELSEGAQVYLEKLRDAARQLEIFVKIESLDEIAEFIFGEFYKVAKETTGIGEDSELSKKLLNDARESLREIFNEYDWYVRKIETEDNNRDRKPHIQGRERVAIYWIAYIFYLNFFRELISEIAIENFKKLIEEFKQEFNKKPENLEEALKYLYEYVSTRYVNGSTMYATISDEDENKIAVDLKSLKEIAINIANIINKNDTDRIIDNAELKAYLARLLPNRNIDDKLEEIFRNSSNLMKNLLAEARTGIRSELMSGFIKWLSGKASKFLKNPSSFGKLILHRSFDPTPLGTSKRPSPDHSTFTEREIIDRVEDFIGESIWNSVYKLVNTIAFVYLEKFKPENSLFIMINSGARGSWIQAHQLIGMRGLIYTTGTAKAGVQLSFHMRYPVTSSISEGMSTVEYFGSTHGARKGVVDTALNTAKTGYLTRQFVDIAHDVIVKEEDCGTTVGIKMPVVEVLPNGEMVENAAIIGRVTARPVIDPRTGEVLVGINEYIDEDKAKRIWEASIETINSLKAHALKEIEVRSPLFCLTKRGVCQKCYGWSVQESKPVELGEAVGIIAAQSAGEPTTQLVMRTFHTGGVGKDITHALPQLKAAASGKLSGSSFYYTGGRMFINIKSGDYVEYLVPAALKPRYKKGALVLKDSVLVSGSGGKAELKADFDGIVRVEDLDGFITISVRSTEGLVTFNVPLGSEVSVEEGQFVKKDEVLFKADGKSFKSPIDGYVELDLVPGRKRITIEGKEDRRTFILPESTEVKVENGSEVNAGDTVAELSADDIVSPWEGFVEVEDVPGRTVISFTLPDGKERVYELPGSVKTAVASGSVPAGTVIAEVNKSKFVAGISGYVSIDEIDGSLVVTVTSEDGGNYNRYILPKIVDLKVRNGDFVNEEDRLVAGPDNVPIKPDSETQVTVKQIGGLKRIKIYRKNEFIDLRYELPADTEARGLVSGKKVFAGDRLVEIIPERIVADIEGTLSHEIIRGHHLISLDGDGISARYVLSEEFEVGVPNGKKVKKGEVIALNGSYEFKAPFAGEVKVEKVPGRLVIKIDNGHISTRYIVPAELSLIERDGGRIKRSEPIVESRSKETVVVSGFDGILEVSGIEKTRKETNIIEVAQVRDGVKVIYKFDNSAIIEADENVYDEERGEFTRQIVAYINKKKARIERTKPRLIVSLDSEKEKIVDFVIPSDAEISDENGRVSKGDVFAVASGDSYVADLDGWVRIETGDGFITLRIENPSGESAIYTLPDDVKLMVKPNEYVVKGSNLVLSDKVEYRAPFAGLLEVKKEPARKRLLVEKKNFTYIFDLDPTARLNEFLLDSLDVAPVHFPASKHEVAKEVQFKGIESIAKDLLNQFQEVYKEKADVNVKHFEVLISQMLNKVYVIDGGDSDYLPGQYIDKIEFIETNTRLKAEGKQPAKGQIAVMGVIEAAKNKDSWLSAASFQETTRVLAEETVKGAVDYLYGLKENVIIGKLIPAGTGFPKYTKVEASPVYSKEELKFFKTTERILKESGKESALEEMEIQENEVRAFLDIGKEESDED
jgi:DNA-directed RNA polymerase beta' subunit